MDKVKAKKLFWSFLAQIENCSDISVTNTETNFVERGMELDNGYRIMVGDDGVIRIYNADYFPLATYTEENADILLVLKELFTEFEL